jgi:hypothetical protein
MADSEPDEDGSAEVSCQEQQNSEGDDDVQEVEASGSRASAKPILRLPERNDEDTTWTRADGTKPAPNYNTPVKDLEYKDLLTITFTVQTSSKS